ncbi:hypothetical protein [Leifsonia sp. SIMBA_070]|uniref:hypothetical protein n=1 Tax=Leifsonia sp. SIMBA_070 TaxID=3085810 RepID=UPI00397A70B7
MSSDASERWLAISERFPIGPKRRNGLLRSTESTEDVVPGQLRQAYWQDAIVAVVIDQVDDDAAQVLAIPATLEPGVENDAAIVIEDVASPLHGPITIWPSSRTSIPFAALGTTIATLPKPLRRVVDEAMTGETGARGVRRGRVTSALGSGNAHALADLFDAIDVLQTAPKLQEAAASVPTHQLQIPLETIMSSLQVPQPRAMAIRLGKEPLTLDEADRLSSTTEIPVEQILDTVVPLPADLQRELQEPRWRDRIRARATDGDEDRARTRLGYEVYQLAARETGQGRERWRQRLQTVLATGSR